MELVLIANVPQELPWRTIAVKWEEEHTPTLHYQVILWKSFLNIHRVLIISKDQVRAGNISVDYIDETVKSILRTKFSLGLFESEFCYLVAI